MWMVLGLAGVVVVLTGWLPPAQAKEIGVTRGAPVLGFLVAITVLAELADRAGVFDAAAAACARRGGGSTRRLFLLIAALGTVITIGMSLDTTAVLLTPVVLTLTDKLGLRPLPFALLAVWLANTASLLLPVSNLTNLLAQQREQLPTLAFAGRMALPELVAVTLTVLYLGVLFRRDLSGRYPVPAAPPRADPWTFWVCAAACAALAPGVIAGIPPWIAATPCAAAAVLVFAVRQPAALRLRLLPWRIVIITEGLFLTVAALSRHGLGELLGRLSGDSSLASAGVAAATSNLVNNLPTYLAMETTVPAGHTTGLLAVLLGTNIGPMVLLWGSLATLLWRERCRARGLHVPAGQFAVIGLGGVPVILAAAFAALQLTQ